jgi:hypothetical protein
VFLYGVSQLRVAIFTPLATESTELASAVTPHLLEQSLWEKHPTSTHPTLPKTCSGQSAVLGLAKPK